MTTTRATPDPFSDPQMARAIADAAGVAPLPVAIAHTGADLNRLGGAELMLILCARYPELGWLLAQARFDALADSPVTLALLTGVADALATRLQAWLHRQQVGEAVRDA